MPNGHLIASLYLKQCYVKAGCVCGCVRGEPIFDMQDRIPGVACRAAVAANLFFDRRMAASCAANLFFNRRSSGGVTWRSRDMIMKNHMIQRAARFEPLRRSGMRGEPIF